MTELILCQKCGNRSSITALECPACGWTEDLRKDNAKKALGTAAVTLGMTVLLGVAGGAGL